MKSTDPLLSLKPNDLPPLASKNDPILRTKLARFNFSDQELNSFQIADTLAKAMMTYGGVGLAANQLGLPHRAFVISAQPIICCFNPLLVDHGVETTSLEEGCLTYPGFLVKVKRWNAIKVRYAEPNGNVVTTKFSGMTARVFQHELEHVDGQHFARNCSRLDLERAIKKAQKRGYNYTFADFK